MSWNNLGIWLDRIKITINTEAVKGWWGHLAHIGEMKCIQQFAKNMKEKDFFKNLNINGTIKLK